MRDPLYKKKGVWWIARIELVLQGNFLLVIIKYMSEILKIIFWV